MKIVIVFTKANVHLIEYCERYNYDYKITSDSRNLTDLLLTPHSKHQRMLVIQDHVKWIGEDPIDIKLDGYPFALCAWDLGVIYFDLFHPDIDLFLENLSISGDFWEAWENVPHKIKYAEVESPKKRYLRNAPTTYPFKHYNSKTNYDFFNFNGKNTQVEKKQKTTFVISATEQSIKIGVASIILPRIELPFLEEWIEHLIDIGVSNIKLYNNGLISVQTEVKSDLDREEKKYKWAKKPYANYNLNKSDSAILKELYNLADNYEQVEIVDWAYGVDHKYKYPLSQMMMVKNVVKDKDTKWLFIDPDEFIDLKRDATLQEFIKRKKLQDTQGVHLLSKIYEERETGRRTLSIKRWSMEDTATKCLVSAPLDWKSWDIHNLKGKEQSYIADRKEIEIMHFCGNPIMHYDEPRKKRYLKAGSPKFKNAEKLAKTDITTFIFNWAGHFKNAVKLENEIKKYSNVIVINSDKEESLPHWVNISEDNYFSGQMLTAINLHSGHKGNFAHIQADCTYDNWEEVYQRADEELSQEQVGIYAPNIDYTPYTDDVVNVRDPNMRGLAYVANTDESVWFLKKEIIDKLKLIEEIFKGNKYGYGWDLVACALAWTSRKLVVRDYLHTINHPKSKGYSDSNATEEMVELLDKLPSHLSRCINTMRSNPKKIYDIYVEGKEQKEFTEKLCVVLVTTQKERDRGDVEKCLDAYFAQETSPYQIDLIISFSQGEVQDYEHLKKYESYDTINNVIIISQQLSDLDDCYIRTPEEAKRRRGNIPSLGASAGANNLFFDTMIPLMRGSYEYYLMIETDSMPIVPNWIMYCISYLKGKKFLIGGSQYKGNSDLGEFEIWQGHLNGIAFYKKSLKLAWLLSKTREFIKYQVMVKNKIFLNFDCAIHLYLSTAKGLKYFRNPSMPQNHLIDTPIITNMSLPSDKDTTLKEVLRKYPQTIILHKK